MRLHHSIKAVASALYRSTDLRKSIISSKNRCLYNW